jgi:hypothetical protein
MNERLIRELDEICVSLAIPPPKVLDRIGLYLESVGKIKPEKSGIVARVQNHEQEPK